MTGKQKSIVDLSPECIQILFKYNSKSNQKQYSKHGMVVNTKIIKKLQKSLPAGYGKIISDRLFEKGIIVTPQHVYAVLNPNNERSNPDVVEEAILLRQECMDEQMKIEQQILSITQ